MRSLLVLGAAAVFVVPAAAQPATQVQLPAPPGVIPVDCSVPGVPPERCRYSFVPGPVTNREQIEVLVDPSGQPTTVAIEQHITLSGTGDYAIRERGPARKVTALDDTDAPIIQRGAVVWQGFVPGDRRLAARIELDPVREAPVLPLRIELDWTPASGAPLAADGRVAGPGTLRVKLVNQTVRPDVLPTADMAAAPLAAALETLRQFAERASDAQPPAAGRGLPASLPAAAAGTRTATIAAALRITGSIRVAGASGVTVRGPGASALASGDGAALSGVLGAGTAEVVLGVPAAGRLVLDLTMVPSLDPRTLRPPAPAQTWTEWAASRPSAAQRLTAFDVLAEAAATTARDDEVAPYLGHPGPGPSTTTYRFALAPPPVVAVPAAPLDARPLPIAVTAAGVLGLAALAMAGWRRL